MELLCFFCKSLKPQNCDLAVSRMAFWHLNRLVLSELSGWLQPNLKNSHWLVSAPQQPGIDMNCQNTWGVLSKNS